MTSKLTITDERIEKIAVWLATESHSLNLEMLTCLRELQERRKAELDSEPVATLDVQSRRPDGNKFALVFSFAAHKLPDDVYFLYRHAQPAPQLKPVGYLFVSDQGAIAYSPTDWGMPGFKLAGQIFGDIDVKEQPAPVVQCPFPCGWDSLNKLAIQDAAFVTLALVAGEPATESIRQAAISNNDRLLKVIAACRAAMLNGGKS